MNSGKEEMLLLRVTRKLSLLVAETGNSFAGTRPGGGTELEQQQLLQKAAKDV